MAMKMVVGTSGNRSNIGLETNFLYAPCSHTRTLVQRSAPSSFWTTLDLTSSRRLEGSVA